jgi:hypothetical protein
MDAFVRLLQPERYELGRLGQNPARKKLSGRQDYSKLEPSRDLD